MSIMNNLWICAVKMLEITSETVGKIVDEVVQEVSQTSSLQHKCVLSSVD